MSDAAENMRAAYHRYRLRTDPWYAFCWMWSYVVLEAFPGEW